MRSRSCKSCLKGMPISLTNDILCREKGVVSGEYLCSKYKAPPSLKTPKELNFKCAECENFKESVALSVNNSVVGTCTLFSTRPFDGQNRGACRKFVIRRIREVI